MESQWIFSTKEFHLLMSVNRTDICSYIHLMSVSINVPFNNTKSSSDNRDTTEINIVTVTIFKIWLSKYHQLKKYWLKNSIDCNAYKLDI